MFGAPIQRQVQNSLSKGGGHVHVDCDSGKFSTDVSETRRTRNRGRVGRNSIVGSGSGAVFVTGQGEGNQEEPGCGLRHGPDLRPKTPRTALHTAPTDRQPTTRAKGGRAPRLVAPHNTGAPRMPLLCRRHVRCSRPCPCSWHNCPRLRAHLRPSTDLRTHPFRR